ncbi:MAG: carboxypeptidase regulatory-like domain-containing protein [Archangium sp.]|nr:carboxypeptidase regulatory-like domain-containing protein [Archangium sp.]
MVVVAALALHLHQLLLAQVAAPAPASTEAPRARMALTSGVALRSMSWVDSSVRVDTTGSGPVHVRLGAAGFLPSLPLGLAIDASGESFRAQGLDLQGASSTVALSALEGTLSIAGRLAPVTGLTLEAHLGYGLSYLPAVTISGRAVNVLSVFRHGPVATGRIAYDRAWFGVSVQGQAAPFALNATGNARATEYTGLAELRLGGLQLGSMQLGGLVDYAVSATNGTATNGTTASWFSHRFGVGFQLRAMPPAPATFSTPATAPAENEPTPASPAPRTKIEGTVRLARTQQPSAAATVEVTGGPTTRTDIAGHFALELAPGKHHLRVSAGTAVAEVDLDVPADSDWTQPPLAVALVAPTDPGTIRGTLTSANPALPLTGARIEATGAAALTVSSDGTFELTNVGPGPVALRVRHPGFVPVDEVVAVPAAGVATVQLTLNPAAQRPLATLRGLIRTTTGVPVRATVTIREVKATLRAGADGRFERRVPGGTYTLQIQAPGYVSQQKRVTVADGDEAIFHTELEAVR